MTTITNGLIEEFIREGMLIRGSFLDCHLVESVRIQWKLYHNLTHAVQPSKQEVFNVLEDMIKRGLVEAVEGAHPYSVEYILVVKRETTHVVNDS